MMDAREALRQIPYLRKMAPAERDALARDCAFRNVARGVSLFSEGDEARGIFLIVSGRIRLVRSSADGREQVLHEEGPGSTLAEVPVFDGAGYVGSAIAVDDSVVFCVPRATLLAALDRSPGSALEVIRILAGRVRTLAGMVEDLSLRAVTERIAVYLLREMTIAGKDCFTLPATRDELAAHVGTVREQASRGLSALKTAGIITVTGRKVCVTDPDRLRVMAGKG
jgi:CRP/FNR family transcriptional regulator